MDYKLLLGVTVVNNKMNISSDHKTLSDISNKNSLDLINIVALSDH